MWTALLMTILFSLGLRVITEEGMLLYPLRKWSLTLAEKSVLLTYLLKPVILCVVCYGSFWGSLFFWGTYQGDSAWAFQWPVVCFGAAALNYAGYAAIELLQFSRDDKKNIVQDRQARLKQYPYNSIQTPSKHTNANGNS